MKKDSEGFTMVELVIAMSIFFIVATALIPLFAFAAKQSNKNRLDVVAHNLANSQMEYIRSLPYDKVGVVDSNPSGIIDGEMAKSIDGVEYRVDTQVDWVDDPADGLNEKDPIPYDYKRIIVTVSCLNPYTKKLEKLASLASNISLEGEETLCDGGNLRITVCHAWKSVGNSNIHPIKGIKVELFKTNEEDIFHQVLYTNDNGKVLFAGLDEDIYTIKVDAESMGYMIHPQQVFKTYQITEGGTVDDRIEVEKPCSIQVHIYDNENKKVSSGSAILDTPFGSKVSKKIEDGFVKMDKLWPVGGGEQGGAYNLNIIASGFLSYDLRQDKAAPWNGFFDFPGQVKDIDIYLKRANACIKVVGNNNPVPGAEVDIYRKGINSAKDECIIKGAETLDDGCIRIGLDDSEYMDEGENGYYYVNVKADGYEKIVGDEHRFRVQDGAQLDMDGHSISEYVVELVPNKAGASLTVIVTDGYGWPINGLPILIECYKSWDGDKSDFSAQTITGIYGSPGYAIFNDLPPGKYKIYRPKSYWYGDKWKLEANIEIQGGQNTVYIEIKNR